MFLKHVIIVIVPLVLFISCERVKYFPDNPVDFEKTYLLAHRGSGARDDGNTLNGCILGLNSLDGIECDIQRSKQNTIWMNHASELESCGEYVGGCFIALNDDRIVEIDSCLGLEKTFSQLESVFKYMGENYPNKYISLDAKPWFPCEANNLNIIRQMDQMANEIIRLTHLYHLENHVLVESETGDFLYYIKEHTNDVQTYLATLGDFDLGVSRALDAGFTGVSFQYDTANPLTNEQIELLHRKGLRIQVWTLNEDSVIKAVLATKPDFIQTDNLSFPKIVP
jgi:glycerophosphoryl diester phosphodiesterase